MVAQVLRSSCKRIQTKFLLPVAAHLPSQPLFSPPQVWFFPTSPDKAATSLTSTRHSRPVRSRVQWWPPLSSSFVPGRRAWTGAMLAGCRMALCSTLSPCHGSPVGAWVWHQACAAMVSATAACTAMMCSVSPLPLRVSGVAEPRFVGGWPSGTWGPSACPLDPRPEVWRTSQSENGPCGV